MPPVRRTLAASVLAVALAAVALTGCAPGGATEPSASTSATPSPEATTISPTPEPTEEAPSADISSPGRCEDIYSPEMLASLLATNPPLNDIGVDLYSTNVVEGIEIIDSGAPSLRCTWGGPSEFGLATSVTIVDAAQAQIISDAVLSQGFTCEPYADGKICRIMDENDYATTGETHYFRGNGWISTNWVNFSPEGYSEDIVATLWG